MVRPADRHPDRDRDRRCGYDRLEIAAMSEASPRAVVASEAVGSVDQMPADERRALEAAMSEGWPASPRHPNAPAKRRRQKL
jgi:hypothetical protein